MKLVATLLLGASLFASAQISNPIIPNGADPWIERDGNTYYLLVTTGRNVQIRKSDTLAGLSKSERKIVWTPPEGKEYSKELWAPEMHKIDGKWYIYVSADAGKNWDHRVYVIENADADPTTTHWTFKGKITTPDDKWSIDMSVFEWQKKWYAIWSGWAGDVNGMQNIYIARMKNPWTLEGPRTMITTPTLAWERIDERFKPEGPNGEVKHVYVNEGPEALIHNGRLFVVYSASGCWTDHYSLGEVELKKGGDPMDAKAWVKNPEPQFVTDPEAKAFSPGHNGFFTSPDGKQDWIVYHANPEAHLGCRGQRSTRVQPFTWNADGTPNFGKPLPLGATIPSPSGEQTKPMGSQ